MSRRSAFTLIELLAILTILVLAACLAVPVLGQVNDPESQQRKSNNYLRGMHQAMVIYAQSNNMFLPGLNDKGVIRTDLKQGEATGLGSSVGGRFWILLDGSFISPNLMQSPAEKCELWKQGELVKPENFSFAMLSISSPKADAGRLAEWADNANGSAVLVSDRNTGKDNRDANVRSVWSAGAGPWQGSVVWGDNHVRFIMPRAANAPGAPAAVNGNPADDTPQSNHGFHTIYNKVQNADDNLFADAPSEGVTEKSKAGSNALMVYP